MNRPKVYTCLCLNKKEVHPRRYLSQSLQDAFENIISANKWSYFTEYHLTFADPNAVMVFLQVWKSLKKNVAEKQKTEESKEEAISLMFEACTIDEKCLLFFQDCYDQHDNHDLSLTFFANCKFVVNIQNIVQHAASLSISGRDVGLHTGILNRVNAYATALYLRANKTPRRMSISGPQAFDRQSQALSRAMIPFKDSIYAMGPREFHLIFTLSLLTLPNLTNVTLANECPMDLHLYLQSFCERPTDSLPCKYLDWSFAYNAECILQIIENLNTNLKLTNLVLRMSYEDDCDTDIVLAKALEAISQSMYLTELHIFVCDGADWEKYLCFLKGLRKIVPTIRPLKLEVDERYLLEFEQITRLKDEMKAISERTGAIEYMGFFWMVFAHSNLPANKAGRQVSKLRMLPKELLKYLHTFLFSLSNCLTAT